MDTGTKAEARWPRVQELFARAIELPEAERHSFVERECGDDSRLLKELADLLAADASVSSHGLLANAVVAAVDATTRDRREALVGRLLGNYRLSKVLGHGGAGTVYLAERADRQYSAQVAIKILDAAPLHCDIGVRFRAERQILASLNHPNIARLIDAGETSEGQPYLVMEYVHGETLDRYCDRRQLDISARLELLLEVCNAVQYAHQNLVVHRDLKPANILVTDNGTPKLLDFGIAKLLEAGGAAPVALTRMNDRLLTPEYASPEQILGRAVTTASDVYALGVVLYELMTGLRPYIVSQAASQLELERSICVTDPIRPSVAVVRAASNTSGEQSQAAVIAAARNLTPERLARRVAGDIEAIIMRALRKEPELRYGSVDQLAEDIRRYLSREPVKARHGNWLYYTQRFARRHALGVTASAVFLFLTIAFAVAMSVQRQRIASERDRAEQESQRAETVSEFMLDVFSAADPFERPGEEVTARELLDVASARINSDLNPQPEVRARLLEAIGRAYRRQHLHDRAIGHLQEALHIRQQLPDAASAKTASVLAELAITLRQAGDLDAADNALRDAIQLTRTHGNQESRVYAQLLANLGRMQLQAGDPASARKYFEESLALTRKIAGPNDPEVASLLTELSAVALWFDDSAAAERLARQAVEIYRRSVHQLHPDRVVAEVRLAETLQSQDRFNEAEPLFLSALETQQKVYGSRSRQMADILDSLASIKRSQGLLTEAKSYAARAVAVQQEALGTDHYMTGYYRTGLAAALIRLGEFADAERELREALATYERTLPPDHQYIASSEHLLGELLLATNRISDAEPMLRAAMNRWKRSDAPPWRAARSASALGHALHRAGRIDEAERLLVDSYKVLALDQTADRDARVKALERVTRFYTAIGRERDLQQLKAELALASDRARNQ